MTKRIFLLRELSDLLAPLRNFAIYSEVKLKVSSGRRSTRSSLRSWIWVWSSRDNLSMLTHLPGKICGLPQNAFNAFSFRAFCSSTCREITSESSSKKFPIEVRLDCLFCLLLHFSFFNWHGRNQTVGRFYCLRDMKWPYKKQIAWSFVGANRVLFVAMPEASEKLRSLWVDIGWIVRRASKSALGCLLPWSMVFFGKNRVLPSVASYWIVATLILVSLNPFDTHSFKGETFPLRTACSRWNFLMCRRFPVEVA